MNKINRKKSRKKSKIKIVTKYDNDDEYISNKGNLGNILLKYIYNKAIYNIDVVNIEDASKRDGDIIKFIEDIKRYGHTFKSSHSFTDGKSLNMWNPMGRKGYLNFWQDIRPNLRNAYNNIIPDKYKNIEHPVIHFRCSDTPFIRFHSYHIPKEDYVEHVSSFLKNKGFNTAIFLNCPSHRSTVYNRKMCHMFSQLYTNLFKNYGITLISRCNSIMEDFYTMIYCPLLISLNESSYSFMAGISKKPDQYISYGNGIEVNNIYSKHKKREADWVLYDHDPVLHKNIKNYYDFNEVKYNILRTKLFHLPH